MAFNLLSDFIDDYRKRALLAAFSFKDLVYRLFAFLLTASLILWLSVFIYVSFYYSYVPAISHIRPVHLEFSSCQEKTGLCSFPSANVTLTHQRQLLKAGQPYNIILDLDLPESEANKQLGMFMVHLKLTGKEGKLIAHSRRTAMLRYKSYTLHLLSTMVFSPFLLAGPMEEKQTLKIEMFTDYLENRDCPLTNMWVQIESRWLELYSANLRVQADFTGLRYFMFYWPALSATIGIATNIIILSFITGYIWYRLLQPNQVVVRVGLGAARNATSSTLSNVLTGSVSQPAIALVEPNNQVENASSSKTIEQRRLEAKEKFLREKQRKLSETTSSSASSPENLRLRSTSFSSVPSVQRIQELSSLSSDGAPESSEEIDFSEGLVMGRGVNVRVAEEKGMEMRQRSSTTEKESKNLKESKDVNDPDN